MIDLCDLFGCTETVLSIRNALSKCTALTFTDQLSCAAFILVLFPFVHSQEINAGSEEVILGRGGGV